AGNDHVFYCPSMEAGGGMKPGPYGFVYGRNPAEPASAQRGFDGWGGQGRTVNIGYEYRVSLTETSSLLLKEAKTCRNMTQVGNLALAVDIISYGAGRFAHKYKHHFVRGEGSVDMFTDRSSPPVWQTYGMTPMQNNDVMFLVLDRPFDYKNYLK
ncbi:MAG TPA: hypothetical protein VFR76_05810, partial [Verrucomicrobiae bacterium]|nr:hypothetical protein [Verrucomicrobiae bacterium]